MDTIEAYFTKRIYHPMSWAIRIANPVSFCKIGPASHCVVIDGASGLAMEASAEHGVRRGPTEILLKGLEIVEKKAFEVPNAEAGLIWMREVAARVPPTSYDWWGALALGLEPDRSWQEDDKWFCFEYFAMGIEKAGRKIYTDNARISAHMLLGIDSAY